MGASVSISDGQKLNQAKLANRPVNFDVGDSMAVFVEEMIARSPKTDEFTRILDTEIGKDAFTQFLIREYAKENVWFFKAVDEMRGKSPYYADFVQDAEFLISTYLSPESNSNVPVSDEVKESLMRLITGEKGESQEEIIKALFEAQYEAINIMALGAFPQFLCSTHYTDYLAMTEIKLIPDKKDQLSNESEVEKNLKVQAKMSLELEKMLAGTSWLSGLLSSIENLPVCVSLAAASHNMRGFPLIYVNAAFETTTGYERSEILGQRGRVEGHESEVESVTRLTEALREAKPLKVAITNWRKDGTAFRNLLAIKPIMDQNGDYAFVLGIQFDIGSKDASARKMKMIDDLFKALPDTVVASHSQIEAYADGDQR